MLLLKKMRPRHSSFLHVYLLITVFLTGFAVLVIEIEGARMISPYFGASLFVWSSLITVTLVSLAGGYWLGGKLAEARPGPQWLFGIILCAAASLAVIPLLRSAVLGSLGLLGLRAGSLAGAACLFSVPLLLLGAVTPYAVKLAAGANMHVAALTGRLYAVSTLGSVAGALATAFILIPHLAADRIFYLLSSALAGLSAYAWLAERKRIHLIIALIVVGAGCTMLFRPVRLPENDRMGVVFRQDSPYSDVRIIDSAYARSLLVNGIVQGTMDRSGMPADRYSYQADSLVHAYHPDVRDVLVVGLGTGAFPKLQQARNEKTDVVEIDPVVCSAARNFFGYQENGGTLFQEDGRYYLRRTREKYDVVFLDAYAAESLPIHLFTLESFRSAARVLRHGGIVAINFHDYRDAKSDRATQSLLLTLNTAFPYVLAFEVDPWHDPAFRNIIFIASEELLALRNSASAVHGSGMIGSLPAPQMIPAAPERGVLLTDDRNSLDYIYNPVSEAMRISTQAAFPKELLL